MATIPAFIVSNQCKVSGQGNIFIESRNKLGFGGKFIININVNFNPATNEYPVGSLTIETDLSDSQRDIFKTEHIDSINLHGLDNPTVFLTGRVNDNLANYKGCTFWLMIANNKPREVQRGFDVVSFVINDGKGQYVAYGTGTLREGDISVSVN